MVGALLVSLAAIGLFTAYRQAVGEPDTSYLTVTRELAPGDRINSDDLQAVAIELPDSVIGTVFDASADLDGAVAITPLGPGELLQTSDVLLANPGEAGDDPPWREFSFTIASARAVDGALRPGETIDLVATYSQSSVAQTVVVFRDATVLRTSEGTDGILSGADATTINVAITDPATLLAAVNAVDDADDLTVVRATKVDGQELPNSFNFEVNVTVPTEAPAEESDG